jgi:hypothetical protein
MDRHGDGNRDVDGQEGLTVALEEREGRGGTDVRNLYPETIPGRLVNSGRLERSHNQPRVEDHSIRSYMVPARETYTAL